MQRVFRRGFVGEEERAIDGRKEKSDEKDFDGKVVLEESVRRLAELVE